MQIQDRKPNLYDDPDEVLTPHWDTSVVVMSVISNTLLVFLRKNIGFRVLQPRWIFTGFVVMFGCGYFELSALNATVTMRQDALTMMALALLMIGGANAQRRKARPGGLSTSHIHTRSRGNSVLFRFFQRPRISEVAFQTRFEPLITFLLGVFCVRVGWELCGWWLAISAICLGGCEVVYAKNREVGLMNLRDNRVEAQMLHAMDSAPDKMQTSATNPSSREQAATLSPELLRLKKDKTSFRK